MSKIRSLFGNSRFLMVLSFVLAVAIWFVVSIVYSPQTTRTLSQIPVEISFAEENTTYHAYSKTELTAKVDVTGKKYAVEQLGSDSIEVTAVVESVNSAGMYTLDLQARKRTANGDYTIGAISPSTINVMIDVEREEVFDVSIDCVGATVNAEGKHGKDLLLEPSFTDETNATLTVTGPNSEVSQIAYVAAVAQVNKELSESTKFNAGIVAYDTDGQVLFDAVNGINALNYVTYSYDTAEITANLHLRREVPLTFTMKNAPADPPKVKLLRTVDGKDLTADSIVIKGDPDTVSRVGSVVLDGDVDFAKIGKNAASSYRFDLKLPVLAGISYDGYNNSSDVRYFALADLSGIAGRTFNIAKENITVTGLQNGWTATVHSDLPSITVMGPASVIRRLSAEDIRVQVDGTAVSATGTATLSSLSVSGRKNCWVSGSASVSVEIAEK